MRPAFATVITEILLASTLTFAQQNPGYLQYQLNEPRGTQVANTGGGGPAFGTIGQDGWQTTAARPFGPGDAGIGALGLDTTSPYDNTIATGWSLNVSGSFTISWQAEPASLSLGWTAWSSFGTG